MICAVTLIFVVLLHITVATPSESYPRPLSPENAARLANWKPEDGPMWQMSGQYQGDILLTPEQRNGLIDSRYRWPNREIPYEISNEFTATERQYIIDVLNYEYSRTCIRMRPKRASDRDYVSVIAGNTGCTSYVGRIGGKQILTLQRPGCVYRSVIAHEFLHAAGFEHQQCATDRDNYVTIQWQNIQDGLAFAFEKYGANRISSFGERYDYGSVMHYDAYAFSKNGQKTIITKDPNAVIGQAPGLSDVDIRKLNKMYNC